MSLLEERYRRVLRLLPASYRAEREEEMVSAFLEGVGDGEEPADEDLARPNWSEIASVAALAMRVRLGGVGAPPERFVWGEGVRLAARLGLLFHAVLGCVSAGGLLRLYGVLGSPPAAGLAPEDIIGTAGSVERLRHLAESAPVVAWVAAYALLVYGHRRAAKVLAVLALLPMIFRLAIDVGTVVGAAPSLADQGRMQIRTDVPYVLLAVVPVLALLAGYHRDAPAARRPPRFFVVPAVAGALAAVALGVVMATPGLGPGIRPWIDPGGLFYLLLLVVGAAYTGVHIFAAGRRSPCWPLALLLLLIPAVFTRIAAFFSYSYDPTAGVGTAMLLIQIAAALPAGLLLVVLAAPMMRRLPSPDPPPGYGADGGSRG
ncbi:MAG TPA: hypothetical protein VF069_05855 [Streptosporangiaceae bacterium]